MAWTRIFFIILYASTSESERYDYAQTTNAYKILSNLFAVGSEEVSTKSFWQFSLYHIETDIRLLICARKIHFINFVITERKKCRFGRMKTSKRRKQSKYSTKWGVKIIEKMKTMDALPLCFQRKHR